ncbi:MAG TPA: hypothetical protein VKB38_10665 [Terracidiphilus sp.]|nr:hypothetical protein [Terracidiphilus sp.]
MATSAAPAAQLSSGARTAIPHDVQQLVVIDYRAMQNSAIAMNLRGSVMPPELQQFEKALTESGFNESHNVNELAFATFRLGSSSESYETVGIAQGQLPTQEILDGFRKKKVKVTAVRDSQVYPLAHTSMVLSFIDPSTMVFGSPDAVRRALDAHDGTGASILTNEPLMDAMKSVDTEPLWSILDPAGTRTMMKQVLGQAGPVTDFESVRSRLLVSSYGMNFQHGVEFNLTVSTGDPFAAATISGLLNAAVVVRKMSGSDEEKQALGATSIDSDSGRLSVHFAASDEDFKALLRSSLFQGMLA